MVDPDVKVFEGSANQDETDSGPDLRIVLPLLHEAVENYAGLRFGPGIYQVSFSLQPGWVAKVSVEAFGDLRTEVDPDDLEKGNISLEPEALGSFVIEGLPGGSVGLAVENLKQRLIAVFQDDLTERQNGIDVMLGTLARMG